MKTQIQSLLWTALFSLFFGSAALAESQVTLESLGGAGAKIYDGVNTEAWVYRDCEVVIMGTSKTPVVQVTVEDSENAFMFWTYVKTFASSPGYDQYSATASDKMNRVPDSSTGSTRDSKVYSNAAPAEGGIAEAVFRADPSSGKLESVQFNYYGQPKNQKINCTKLKLRKPRQ